MNTKGHEGWTFGEVGVVWRGFSSGCELEESLAGQETPPKKV